MNIVKGDESELPTLSAVVNKVIAVASDPNASADDLADVISYEQGLTNKLLKLANSLYYAQRTKVETIKRAVTVIGFDEIIGIALAMEVFGSLKKHKGVKFYWESLWIHGVGVAIASKEIAKHSSPDLARKIFIPGLLHDTGKIFLLVFFAEEYREVLRVAVENKIALWSVEQKIFGIDHSELTYLLMDHWNFPESIMLPCRCHHNPDTAAAGFKKHAAIINLADYIVIRAGIGKKGMQVPAVLKTSPEKIGIQPSSLKMAINFVRRKEDEIKEFFNIAAG